MLDAYIFNFVFPKKKSFFPCTVTKETRLPPLYYYNTATHQKPSWFDQYYIDQSWQSRRKRWWILEHLNFNLQLLCMLERLHIWLSNYLACLLWEEWLDSSTLGQFLMKSESPGDPLLIFNPCNSSEKIRKSTEMSLKSFWLRAWTDVQDKG